MVEIREMRLEDLPAVFALGQKLFTAEELPTLYRCWHDDEVMQLFASDEEICLVAVTEDKHLAGFALGSVMEKPHNAWRYGWLEWLGVDPAFKRHGVATRLVNQLTRLFIKREARIMLVDTDVDNKDALAFFRKNDFGHEMQHVYLSRNLDTHPDSIERREARNGNAD